MRHMHRWEDLRPEEFFEEFERAPIAYWACGPMEDHELQNALGIDPCKAYAICDRAAAIAGGVVFPMVPFAPGGSPALSHAELRERGPLFPPSLFSGRELCERIYTELFESLADLGFKVCMAFGGHGPAATLLRQIAEARGGRVDAMRIWTGGSTSLITDVMADDPVCRGDACHGGVWETSMNMALNPEYVDLSRVRSIESSPINSQLKGMSEARLQALEQANVAFGERLIATAAERLAAKAREMLEGE